MKVFVFNKDFLTDYSDGLGVIISKDMKTAIRDMARMVTWNWQDNPKNTKELIRQFRKLDIQEYEIEEFPGMFIHGGA